MKLREAPMKLWCSPEEALNEVPMCVQWNSNECTVKFQWMYDEVPMNVRWSSNECFMKL